MSKYKINRFNLFFPLLFASSLTACGGSSNDKKDVPNQENTAPTIQLVGASPQTLSYTSDYTELGANANDAEDGTLSVSITGNVGVGLGEYVITYTAIDSEGLSASVERVVNVIDDIAPEILINEATTEIAIQTGYVYLEPGASATDEIDGELIVGITSDINTAVPDDYHVTYTATDASGNIATVQRLVVVTPIKHRLEISSFGLGSFELNNTSASLTCDERLCYTYVEQGTALEVVGQADAGYELDKWANCDNVSGNICSITINSSHVIDAQFISQRPLEIASNVIELTNEQIAEIANYNVDSGLITFSAGMDVSQISVNKIIISKGIYNAADDPDNVEVYFARRVSRITGLAGAPTFIETSEVTLEDIILDGTISVDEAFTANDVVQSSLPKGVMIDQSKINQVVNSGGVAARDISIPLGIDIALDEDVTVKGNVALTIDPNINLDFSLIDGLREFRTIVTTGVSGSLAVEFKNELPLKQYKKAIGNPLRLTPVIVGPVVFIPEIQLYIEVNAKFEATLTSTATLSASITGGAHYLKSAGWKAIKSNTLANNMALPQIEAKGSVEVGPTVDLGLLVYGVAGPAVGANIFAGGEIYPVLNNDQSQCAWNYNIYLGGKGTFKGKFKLLKKALKYETTLFNTKKVINSREVDCEIQPPEIPLSLKAGNITQQTIDLEWEYSADVAAVTFDIYRDFSPIARKVKGLSFTDSGLNKGTDYCYTVVAVNSKGDRSKESNAMCATTEDLDTTAPETPANLVAEVLSTTAVKLNWNAAIDDSGETSYVVYDTDFSTPIVNTASESFEALGLLSETEYCFQVAAVDASGNESAKSNVACATTLAPEFADWRMQFGCLGLDPLVNVPVELNLESTSSISYVGNTLDYDGQTPFVFVLSGIYDTATESIDGRITSTFEQTSDVRIDTFSADISSGDSGAVAMTKITEFGGCDAQVRFLESDPTSVTNSINATKVNTARSNTSLSLLRGF